MLIRIHKELIASIPSFNITSYDSNKPWTDAMTKYFHELGENKGYRSRSRYSNGEHMGLDMVWKKPNGNIILALEHENKHDFEKVSRTELSKLVDVKSPNKIMICYPGNDDQLVLEELQNKIKANKYTKKEYYLLMMGSQGIEKDVLDPFIRFESYLLDNEGKIVWKTDTGTISTIMEK